MVDATLPLAAAYLLGYANAYRDIEFDVKVAIDRPCASAAESLAFAEEAIGRATTARDQHKWHTTRVTDMRNYAPAERRD